MRDLSVLAFCAVLLISCSSHQDDSYLRLRLTADPTTLDPAYIVDVPGGQVAAKIFDGLVSYDDKARIVPGLASSWSTSPDGKTYTFNIRSGVKFSNGREVTAPDFKYSFQRVLAPITKSPRTWLFDRIAGSKEFMEGQRAEVTGIKCKGPHTLVIELSAPFGPFLGLLAMPGAYVVPKEEVEKDPEHFSDSPVGTGLYMLERWDHGSRLLVKANRDYFEGPPAVKGISYRVIPEELTAVAEFERGNLDALNVPAPEYRRYSTDPRWKDNLISQVGLNTYYLGLNCSRPPLDDVRVRRAISMAVDRKRILDTLYEGRGVLASGPVPSFLLPPPGKFIYGYNPAEAKRLLNESGHPDGLKLKIYIGAEQETLDMVEVIQQYLSEIGIEASIVQLEWSAFKQAINEGQADLFWLSWQADYPDPENFLYPVFYSGNMGPSGNRARLNDREFDSLITCAQIEPDPEKRRALYEKAQMRVVELSPWVFFWHKKDYVVLGPKVKGYRLYPISNSDKGLGVSVSGG